MAALPQFTWKVPESYRRLHADLWPASESDGSSVSVLDNRIEFLTPDDGWLTLSTDSESLVVSHQPGDNLDEGPARIGFIDLKTYPNLAIPGLPTEHGAHAAFIVRHEYDVFLNHAISCVNDWHTISPGGPQFNLPTRFFVTGQPGIGKTFGSYYFLFRLLALGQPVFFVESPTDTLYFSSVGVQANDSAAGLSEYDATLEAIKTSWVLIDVDDSVGEWCCPKIFATARCVVWTSPPREPRTHQFKTRFNAETWYMKTWSLKEIAAATQRFEIDRREILQRMDTEGPVARSLFRVAAHAVSTADLWVTIDCAIHSNIFKFAPVDANGCTGFLPVHSVIKIEPRVVIDDLGRAGLRRANYDAGFMSPLIAQMTLDLLQNRLNEVQKQLAATVHVSSTRTLAGKVVEDLMNRALERGIKLPEGFGALRPDPQHSSVIRFEG
ncbi:hypothetical protein C8F01DRAFT_381800 [Mycena amicta]|nr:hypothetical protein C8F01DRAFT_381800 [Mycena amicta]